MTRRRHFACVYSDKDLFCAERVGVEHRLRNPTTIRLADDPQVSIVCYAGQDVRPWTFELDANTPALPSEAA